MKKTLVEMDNNELFGVLAGMQGVMAKLYLQDAINAYRRDFGMNSKADLVTMVQHYVTTDLQKAS